jgi:hypothetical protein
MSFSYESVSYRFHILAKGGGFVYDVSEQVSISSKQKKKEFILLRVAFTVPYSVFPGSCLLALVRCFLLTVIY